MIRQQNESMDVEERSRRRELRNQASAVEASFRGEPEDPVRADWNHLVARIRRGDEKASSDFANAFLPGARLLFKRRLGPVRSERLAVEAVAGAMEEVRRGWITDPRDMVHFLREIAVREEKTPGLVVGVADFVRSVSKSSQIEEALRHFSPEERDVLNRYYLGGQTPERIEGETGFRVAQQADLRERIREMVREQPAQAEARPMVKRAAAG